MESPAPSALESLPLFLLEDICEYLAPTSSLTYRLRALSLTSKTCRFASDKRRFKYINITVESDTQLQKDIDGWKSILSAERARNVRYLKISGSCFQNPDHQDTRERLERANKYYLANSLASEGEEEKVDWIAPSQDDTFFQPSTKVFDLFFLAIGCGAKRRGVDIGWQPLVDLLLRMPALQDFVYSHTDHFPSCLLSTLHSDALNCRLHLHTVELALLMAKSQRQDRAHNSNALLTSPCLHSLVVWDCSADGNISPHHEKAAIAVASRSAPNLRNIRMIASRLVVTIQGINQGSPPAQFDDCLDGAVSQKSQPQLESLHLDASYRSLLPKWESYAGFCQLKSLRLLGDVRSNTIRLLTGIASGGALARLHSLCIEIYPYRSDEHDTDNTLSTLLLALPPLTFLEVGGFINRRTLVAIVTHHLPLQHLSFMPFDGPFMARDLFIVGEDIALLERLPQLESLKMVVRRSSRPPTEFSVYQALSKLMSLRKVELILSTFRQHLFWGSIRKHMRLNKLKKNDKRDLAHFLADVALEEALARAVFHMIASQNGVKHLKLTMQLDLYSISAFSWCEGYSQMLRWVARKWQCSKDTEGVVHVRELDEPQRLALKSTGDLGLDSPAAERDWKEVWDMAWPPEKRSASDNEDWTERWWSQPVNGAELPLIGGRQKERANPRVRERGEMATKANQGKREDRKSNDEPRNS